MMRNRIGAAVLVALALTLSACGRQGTVYHVGPDAARDTLVGARIPDLAFGGEAHAEPAVATADGVAWHIVMGTDLTGGSGAGGPVMILTATFAAADGGTLITVDVKPGSGDAAAFEKQMSDHPQVAELFRVIAGEAVDAALSHRDFDFGHIRTQTAIATVSLLPEIRQQMDDAARAAEQRDQDSIDNAYRQAGAGR